MSWWHQGVKAAAAFNPYKGPTVCSRSMLVGGESLFPLLLCPSPPILPSIHPCTNISIQVHMSAPDPNTYTDTHTDTHTHTPTDRHTFLKEPLPGCGVCSFVCVWMQRKLGGGGVRKQQVGGHCPTSKGTNHPPKTPYDCFTTQRQTLLIFCLCVCVCACLSILMRDNFGSIPSSRGDFGWSWQIQRAVWGLRG